MREMRVNRDRALYTPSDLLRLPFSTDNAFVAYAGNVTDKIDGLWQAFWYYSNDASVIEVTPCGGWGCGISHPSSEDIDGSNIQPWLLDSGSKCTRLSVVEGRTSGESEFSVWDGSINLGATSSGASISATCGDNPNVCYLVVPDASKGDFDLGPGKHSITIYRSRANSTLSSWDIGWFKLSTIPCPGTTPTCPAQCIPCVKRNKPCLKNADCCSKKCKVKVVNGKRSKLCVP